MTSEKPTEAQMRALERLAAVPEGMVLQCSGHIAVACYTLAMKFRFAEDLGRDQWTGSFYRITPEGRAYHLVHGRAQNDLD